jgi:rod shape-determining protein MreC
MLLTNPGFKAGAMLKEAQINGIIAGEGEGRARLRYIPLDAVVRKGELVVTSGLSSNSPRGLVIGRVVSVGKSPTGLYKYADIEPSADPLSQEVVLCIR